MEDITDTSDSAGYNDPVDVLYPLKAQARALRREYKETQQDTEQMSRILIQSLLHDRDIDQEYRQTVVKTQSNKRTYEASFYDSGLIEEDVLDEEDIIKRFIHAVKKKRHISRPHQVNTRRSAAAVR